jgi:arsenite methyltransferase
VTGSLPPAPPAALKCACADLWSHPLAQLLAGPTLRPGGRALTRTLIERLDLAPGARALDIGSGTGATLEELSGAGAQAFGVDYSATLAAQAGDVGRVALGDAEALPFADGAFAAVFVECVLSAVPDKAIALRECRRVLDVGGRLAVSDMTVSGEFPEPLHTVAVWAACVGGATSCEGNVELLGDAGFRIELVTDQSPTLGALVDQAERRLAMLRGALGLGLLEQGGDLLGNELARYGLPTSAGGLTALADLVFAQVRRSIDDGALGYAAFVAVA